MTGLTRLGAGLLLGFFPVLSVGDMGGIGAAGTATAASAATAAPAEDLDRTISRARELAFARRFDEAVALYDEVLRQTPDRWDAALGRADALVWGGRYAPAELAYRGLLARRPDSLEAVRGLARTTYWSGDFRQALRFFKRVSIQAPSDAEAREAVANLEALMRPVATLLLEVAHDDQPADRAAAQSKIAWGLDPLTTVAAELGGLRLDAEDAGGLERFGDARVGVSARFPNAALDASARIGARRFSDGATAALLDARLERRFPAITLVAAVMRDTALDSAPSYLAHQTLEWFSLGVRRDEAGPKPARNRITGAAEMRILRFGDGNAGLSASAWAEIPLARLGPVSVAAILASSYRDTREDRVRAVFAGSTPLTAGGYAYEIRTFFDPYVTPDRQLEGRLGLHARLAATRSLSIALFTEVGAGRERATGFGPTSGFTATPVALAPGTFVRRYSPYRAALAGSLVSGTTTLKAEVSRASSAFYTVTAATLGVTRRF